MEVNTLSAGSVFIHGDQNWLERADALPPSGDRPSAGTVIIIKLDKPVNDFVYFLLTWGFEQADEISRNLVAPQVLKNPTRYNMPGSNGGYNIDHEFLIWRTPCFWQYI